MKQKTKILLLAVLLVGTSFGQKETVGFEFNQHFRYLDTLRTSSNIWTMNYRNYLTPNTRLAITLGLDNVKFFENDTTINPLLKSNNQIFLQLEGLQKIFYMYIKGAVQFYSIKGYATEVTSGHSEVLHYNTYRMFEFPIGAGFTVPISKFELYLGVNETLFYGTNEKEIIVYNSGTETSLGITPKRSFSTSMGLGLDATVIYHFSDNLDVEVDFVKYKDKDYSFRLSIWGPLKRMLYIN